MTNAIYEIEKLRWELGPSFVLQVDDLDIPAGSTTLLLGPSASGKSSLLSLLGRVEGTYFPPPIPKLLTGEIRFDGLDLLSLSERELMKRHIRGPEIGFVFQREGLFEGLSVVENVSWPLVAHPDTIQHVRVDGDRVRYDTIMVGAFDSRGLSPDYWEKVDRSPGPADLLAVTFHRKFRHPKQLLVGGAVAGGTCFLLGASVAALWMRRRARRLANASAARDAPEPIR